MKKLRALGARYLPQPLKRLLWKAYHTVYFLRYRREPRYPHLPGPKNDLPRIVIACNEYGAYCIPRSSYHRRTSQTILDGRVYEAETIRFMLSHCANGDIVQAGACFGDFLPALSHGCAAGAHIWSFEPGAENYRCALVTIALNDLKNVTLRHTGLGSETGTGRLVIRDRHGIPLGAASQVEWANAVLNPDQSEPIELVSIDQSVPEPRNVSIMQLDVE